MKFSSPRDLWSASDVAPFLAWHSKYVLAWHTYHSCMTFETCLIQRKQGNVSFMLNKSRTSVFFLCGAKRFSDTVFSTLSVMSCFCSQRIFEPQPRIGGASSRDCWKVMFAQTFSTSSKFALPNCPDCSGRNSNWG